MVAFILIIREAAWYGNSGDDASDDSYWVLPMCQLFLQVLVSINSFNPPNNPRK